MGELHEKMSADLKIGGYSPSTQKIYLLYAKQFGTTACSHWSGRISIASFRTSG